MDPALKALLTATVGLAAVSTRTASGQPAYGATTNLAARVEEEYRQIEGPQGTTITTTHRIYVDGDASPAPVVGSRLWLPGFSAAADARVIHQVHTLENPGGGIDHYEVLV